jgi:hypothetical protein
MTTNLGDVAKQHIRHIGKEWRLVTMVVVCNGSGGVTSVDADDPACTAADGGANGDLDITFPAFAKGQIFAHLFSPLNTVSYVHFSVFAPTAGTASVITGKNTTNTDPASADEIHIQIWGTVSQ